MKLYVDADETLVIWGVGLEINYALVDILHAGINSGKYDITIWQYLNNSLQLPYGIKHELYLSVPRKSYAIDNRKEVDKEYLVNFKKVFTSDEFISFQKIGPL